jgi:hypothetical protein
MGGVTGHPLFRIYKPIPPSPLAWNCRALRQLKGYRVDRSLNVPLKAKCCAVSMIELISVIDLSNKEDKERPAVRIANNLRIWNGSAPLPRIILP